MRVSKEGLNLILFFFFIGLVFMVMSIIDLSLIIGAAIVFMLNILMIIFFRDPDREIGRSIVSPADGEVIMVDDFYDKDIGESVRLSVFMGILDVHVNRMPLDGKVVEVRRERGTFLPAYSRRSDKNEKNIIIAETKIGRIKIVQIAGLFARRIVCYVKEGDVVNKGVRIGMIKFGSRVDLIMPKERVKLKVKRGDRVKAGVDDVAEIYG